MTPVLFIKLGDGRELAVGFVTRERTSGFTHAERPASIHEVIDGLRALPPMLSSRVATTSHLESEVPE
jgi:hypothetical protein